MKKLLVCFAVLALLLVPAMANAALPGEPLPVGAVEVEHWELAADGVTWVHKEPGNGLARCWRSGGAQGECNQTSYVVNITHHAAMAQWSEWSIGGTRWDWRILKPGTYAADCIEFKLQSNNSVLIDYEDFADLLRTTEGGVKQTIDTYYSFGESIGQAESNGWVRAADLNEHDDIIPDSAVLHVNYVTKLFNKIVVENCNSSGEYEDTAVITLTLLNQQPWVDPAGGWGDQSLPTQ